MLVGIPTSIFTWGYEIHDDAEAVARVDFSFWNEKADVQIGSESLTIRRDGMTGPWLMQRNGQTVATLKKESFWTSTMTISCDGRTCRMEAQGWFCRGMRLLEGDAEIGTIDSAGLFGRKMNINLPSNLPFYVTVLAVFGTALIWQRASSSS